MAIYGYIKIACYFSFFPCAFYHRSLSEKMLSLFFHKSDKNLISPLQAVGRVI